MTKRSQFQAHLRVHLRKRAASVLVTHSCGHQQAHDLYGKAWQRDSKEAWLESTPCRECWQAQQQEAAQAAQVQAQRRHLPPLSGSEKQVAWAETLRAKGLAAADAAMVEEEKMFMENLADGEEDEEQLRRQFAAVQAADVSLRQEVAARWWIDYRSRGGAELLGLKIREGEMSKRSQFQDHLRARLLRGEIQVNRQPSTVNRQPSHLSQGSPTPTYPQPLATPRMGYRWVWDPAKGQWDQVANTPEPGKTAASRPVQEEGPLILGNYLKLS